MVVPVSVTVGYIMARGNGGGCYSWLYYGRTVVNGGGCYRWIYYGRIQVTCVVWHQQENQGYMKNVFCPAMISSLHNSTHPPEMEINDPKTMATHAVLSPRGTRMSLHSCIFLICILHTEWLPECSVKECSSNDNNKNTWPNWHLAFFFLLLFVFRDRTVPFPNPWGVAALCWHLPYRGHSAPALR